MLGRRTLKLTELPTRAEVVDAMGSDPRRDGCKTWEIGRQPPSVLSGKLPAPMLAAACLKALLRP